MPTRRPRPSRSSPRPRRTRRPAWSRSTPSGSPRLSQNSNYETISTIALPARPAGFPGNGGKVFLTYVVNNSQGFSESTFANNLFRVPTPVTITDPLPDLQVTAFNLPSTLQPGDVISPTIRIVNLGASDPALQGPVIVALVASEDNKFGPGDAVVASYVINSIPGVSGVPTAGSIADDANFIPPTNTNTTLVPAFKLPTTPGFYYLGIVIDPFHTINQTYAPSADLRNPVTVGPPSQLLPSGNLVSSTNGAVPVFPAAPSTVINPVTSGAILIPPLVSTINTTTFQVNGTGLISTSAVHANAQGDARPPPAHATAHVKAKATHPKAKH